MWKLLTLLQMSEDIKVCQHRQPRDGSCGRQVGSLMASCACSSVMSWGASQRGLGPALRGPSGHPVTSAELTQGTRRMDVP